MKARVTTVLSLGGILIAGSAAALVNSQVLLNSTPSRPGAADIIATLPPSTTVPTVDPSASTVVDPAAVPTTLVTLPSPSPSQAAYQVGMSGTVTVDTGGDVLHLVAPTPAPGWAVVKSEQTDPLNASVVFQSAGQLVTFRAALLFGVVNTSTQVESFAVSLGSTPPTSVASLPPPGTTPAPPPSTKPVTPATPVTQVTVRPGPVTTVSTPTTVDDHGGGGSGGGGGKGRGRGGDD